METFERISTLVSGEMGGAALVAIAAAIGNLLQGWDNATIAGNLLFYVYISLLYGLRLICFYMSSIYKG